MKKILLFTLLIGFGYMQAQNVNIPDVNFKSLLLNQSTSIDTNNDGEIQVTEAEAYTSPIDSELFINYGACGQDCAAMFPEYDQDYLDCVQSCEANIPFIKDLTGIEAFINISTIRLNNFNFSLENQTDLDFSNFNNLTTFQLLITPNDNDISFNINFDNLPFLNTVWVQKLGFSYTGSNLALGQVTIPDFGFHNSNSIFDFAFSGIEHSNFDLSSLSNLTFLLLDNNDTIDLSNSPNLLELGISGLGITELDLSNNPNLYSIYLNDLGVSELNLSNNLNLDTIQIYNFPNLTYINAKYGNNNNTYIEEVGNLPNLQTVCVDDINSSFTSEFQSYFSQAISFTEDCNLTSDYSNQIFGQIKYDNNANGCDADDISLQNIMVITTNTTDSIATFTQSNGEYLLYTDEGDYTTTITNNLPSYITYNPNMHTSSFVGSNNTDTSDFCFEPNQTINDVNISIYPLTEARPGFDTSYLIEYNNVGTTQLDGSIIFEYDDSKLSLLNVSETISSQVENTLNFDYSNLQVLESRIIQLDFNILAPPTNQINDVLNFSAIILPIDNDNSEEDNSFIFNQTVVGSYDPNDIQVVEGSEILFSDADKYLHYIIRFQNTGTASAINVHVNNVLDNKLDWNTLQLENTSHDGRVSITDGNNVNFIFDNINLPDSTNDEPNSHGYISYKIKPKATVLLGDIITNKADIYFDFNEAIITNTVSTEFVNTLSQINYHLSDFLVYPNPTKDILNIDSENKIKSLEIYNHLGQKILIQSNNNSHIDVSELNSGLYFIKLIAMNNFSLIEKFVKN